MEPNARCLHGRGTLQNVINRADSCKSCAADGASMLNELATSILAVLTDPRIYENHWQTTLVIDEPQTSEERAAIHEQCTALKEFYPYDSSEIGREY